MVLAITTSLKGHFLNYFDILKSNSSLQVKLVNFENSNVFIRMIRIFIFIYVNYKEINKIIILNGDQDVILSLILKIIFTFKTVKLIIYYTYQNKKKSLFKLIKKFLLCISSIIGVKIYLLECDTNNVRCLLSNKNFEKLYDPILLSEEKIEEEYISQDELTYLLAGFIDDRKCVRESIAALELLSCKDKIKRKLIILGEQSTDISEYLTYLQFEKLNLKIEIYNKRFSDEDLSKYLKGSHIVLAIYKEHFGSSGMLINAILNNKKVLFIPVGVLNNFAIELEINNLPNSYDINEICSSMEYIEKKEYQYSFFHRNMFLGFRKQQIFSNKVLS